MTSIEATTSSTGCAPRTSERWLALVQLPLSLAVLILVPSNGLKTLALLVVWALTFRRLSAQEVRLVVLVNAIFIGMDAAAIKRGVFSFTAPDALGLPLWEFFMWGFYALHAKRLLGEEGKRGGVAILVFVVLFALAFPLFPESKRLLVCTGVLLALALVWFHEREDLRAVAYFVLLGAAVEFVGVRGGLWSYSGTPLLGFPVWFITMWAGVGLLLRRLFLPLSGFSGFRDARLSERQPM